MTVKASKTGARPLNGESVSGVSSVSSVSSVSAVPKTPIFRPLLPTGCRPKLAEFARYYETAILPCLPGTPEHKGRVENSVGSVKDNALKARVFDSLEAQNQHLAGWERSVADRRIHGTTKRPVAQLFAEEQKHLRPLPSSVFPVFQEAPRTVHRDSYVEVAKAYYAVPPDHPSIPTHH